MANFNPDNRRVQLYGDEGTTTIEKNLEGIFGEVIKNPTAFKKSYEGLIKSQKVLEDRNKELFNENKQLKEKLSNAKVSFLTDLVKKEKEKKALEGQIGSKEGVLVEFSKSIQELRDYQERIFRVLGADISNPGTYHIKVIEDMYKFLHTHTTDSYKFTYDGNLYIVADKPGEHRLFPKISYYGTPTNGIVVKNFTDTSTALVKKFSLEINGKVHEFAADNIPRYFNLPEMFDEITDLRIGLQEVWDTTKLTSINDIKKLLEVGGKNYGLKVLRQDREALRAMLNGVKGFINTNPISDDEVLRLVELIVNDRGKLFTMKQAVRAILEQMKTRLCDEKTRISRKSMSLTGWKTIKGEVKTWFDQLQTVLEWNDAMVWKDPEK